MMKFILIMIMFLMTINLGNYLYMYMYMLFSMMFLMFFMKFSFYSMNFWMNLYYNMGMDLYSWSLILLTIWILMLMMLFSNNSMIFINQIFYMFMMLLTMIFLFLCFISMNLMMFYIWFESSLIPIFFLILGWGYQPERIQAGFYMMLYTLFGSMPLFFMILYLYKNNMILLMNILIINNLNMYMYMGLMMGFLIKMPIYMMHLWLPKAHVEAPVMGSMILAGVMLKLGTYGILRMILMMNLMFMYLNMIILLFSIIGGLISCFICLFQIDMKMLVAYSSVVHMSILLSGMMSMFNWGIKGSILMMIAHGLCSSGMFSLVNINYERFKSRSLYMNKGTMNYFPSLSMMWFMLCSSNMSFPPSLNLFSEIMLINSMVMWLKFMMLILLLLVFLSSSYSLYLYSYSQHGKMNYSIYLFSMIFMSEYLLLILHWIPLNLMFLMLNLF